MKVQISNIILTIISVTTIISFSTCKENRPISAPNTSLRNLVDLVYPQLDTENSRWFLFSSACRPFGMVNLSPDTQIDGAWGSGYRYKTDTIKGFSHVHGWQLSGLSVMPMSLKKEREDDVFNDFYSAFSHENEKIAPGYHKVLLERFGIEAELTSTKRVGLHRYTFPDESKPAVLFNLNTPLGPCANQDGILNKASEHTLTGHLEMAPTHRRPKPIKLFFHISFNAKIEAIQKDMGTGNYVVYTDAKQNGVLMKVGLSYTSIANAENNMAIELDHWDFERVVKESQHEWNTMLGRIQVQGGTELQQKRFYTDLWHALQGRRIINDVNGAYPDNTGDGLKVGQLPLDADGRSKFNHYNSDSFWGAQWTLNTLWGLVYPDITEEFVYSLMQYYKDGGLIPRGPSGGNYTYVMTGASTTPFVVSAVQKNIFKKDLDSVYEALRKNHLPGGIMEKAGYEHNTSLGGGLGHYLSKGYVPYPIPEGKFGGHQDGASLTLEYAYQDWTLAQFAKKLQREEDYKTFMNRSQNYKNVFDAGTGWMRPKDVHGQWKRDFDPYLYENGFNESNGAQATWFVPHDLKGLVKLMGGEEKAVERLNGQFKASEELGFTSGTSHEVEVHPEYSRIPINFGNQPSINTTFVFNYLGRPDLTQYWSREIIDKVFSGLDSSTGYNGDEDQGLMGALSVLLKMGLFQMNGGTEADPGYDLGSPLFDKITISLHPNYYKGDKFVIETINNSKSNRLVEQVSFDGRILDTMAIRHSNIVNGGRLTFQFKEY
jgi:predicted alpha-1,2-mannosidase